MSIRPEHTDVTEVDAEYLLSTSGNGHNSKAIHLPSEESTRENPDPLCNHERRRCEFLIKEPSVYPPGYRRVCSDCLRESEGEL